ALERQNADLPGGNVTEERQELTLRTLGRVTDPAAFGDLVITTRSRPNVPEASGTPIRVRDIGRVEDGTKEQRSLARLNGAPTVTLEIRRQSGANTIAVINGIKEALPVVGAQLPSDVKLEIINDQSNYIEAALHEIKVHLVIGSILASLVVLLFMRSWRATIIAGIAIPSSVIATFGMMWALDFTLNSVTMLALVLMVGIVIDDAIVVLENIFRFIEEKKMKPRDAAREATRDIGLPVLATTLSLVVIFLPVSFMSSISGRFLYQFGITAAVAILVSLLVSFTLTPMMSSRLLKTTDADAGHGGSRGGFYSHIDRNYVRLLRYAMAHRPLVSIVAIVVIVTAVPLYMVVKQEFVPSDVDEGEFEVGVTAPLGTNLAAMDEAMTAIESDVRKIRGVTMMLSTVGGGFLSATSSGSIYVRLVPHEERTLSFTKFWHSLKRGKPWQVFTNNYSARDVMAEVRKLGRKYAPIRVAPRNPRSFNFGPGGRWDIYFVLRGPSIERLAAYANELMERSEKLGGIIDMDTSLELDKPELRAVIDRERAAALGVSTTDIATSLNVMVGGDQEVTRYRDASLNEDYDVQLRVESGNRSDPAAIERLYV
ncbi:MAG: efflux RND transporter permease subunit, partial [Gammaproteobacteria bacterium]